MTKNALNSCLLHSATLLLVLTASCSRPQGAQPGAGATPSSLRHTDSPPAAAPLAVTEPSPALTQPQPSAAVLLPGSPAHHGSELYGRMCAVCHGANGEGYKADQATALNGPDYLAAVSDQQIGAAIALGRKGTTM